MASSGQESERLNAQLLVDSIPALIHTARPDGYLDYFNKPWLEYLGVTLDKVIGWNWTAYVHPEDVEGILAKWRACLATGEIFEYETRVRRADGEYRWMFHRKVPLRDANGNIVKWYGSSLDIEERKMAEEQLRRNAEGLRLSERELRDVLDSIPAVVWSALPEGSNTFVNSRWVEYSGLPSDQMTGSGWHAVTHPDDLERHNTKWLACVASGEPFEDEVRFRRADGQYRWHLQRGVPLRDEAGNIVKWYGVLADIEDRKRTELALQLISRDLQESKSKLEEAQRITHVGYWEWDISTGRVNWSDETYRIYGMQPQERPMDIATCQEKIYPEDWQRGMEEALGGGARFNAECRVIRPTGEVRIAHFQGDVKRDASGRPTLMFGTVQDITERKQAENKIRRLVDANILGIFIWHVEGAIVEANEAFLRMVQYSRKELVSGRLRWTDLRPEEWRERGERALAELKATGFAQPFEREFFRKDGSRVPVLMGGALFEESGREGVAFVLDLTEQKRAEAVIREGERELRQMLDLTPQYLAVLGSDGSPLYANRASLDYLGISLDEWRQRRGIGDEVHPDDVKRLIATADRASSSGSAYELELRVRKGDGSFRWFLSRFHPVHDEKGQLTRWYVASTDIDDRKRAEERLQQENVALREEIDKASMFEEIVGTSRALQTVLSRISKVAPSNSTVLITGETGTGKELVARAIHRRSNRSSRAFVSVNCAAIPRELIASELFGHEKGAFTGATQQRMGRFELASGGTLFLDEVGELPAETQIALLRVLQEHEFERVGGTRPIRADVRVIAATNRDLQAAISAGAFRSDLFYRLHVFPIAMPALRERKEDIPLLVEYFIERYARKAGKKITTVDKKTLRLLESYPWPGNIRELQNVIERSVIVCETTNFSVDESWLSQQPRDGGAEDKLYLSDKMAAQEKAIIEAALRESQGRVSGPSGAAAKLGIAPSTLDSKIRSLKINKNRFRA